MSDLISRQDAIDAIELSMTAFVFDEMTIKEVLKEIADNTKEIAISRIKHLPSADAKGDLIRRADIQYHTQLEPMGNGQYSDVEVAYKDDIDALPSADAVHGYTEWLEKIIVEAETFEWLCEDTPCKEWCDENCHYSSIQAECLRHLYEVSKGGDAE